MNEPLDGGRMIKRGSGILLHITSLPSRYGVGDIGPGAFGFADFLAEAGQKYWQMLPLSPTCIAYGNSPYSSFSAFAGNPLLISPEQMVEDGMLSKSDIRPQPAFASVRVDYRAAVDFKEKILRIAFENNRSGLEKDRGFKAFCSEHSFWLDDYALFSALRRFFGGAGWSGWPEGIRARKEGAIAEWKTTLRDETLKEKIQQFIFFRQWSALRNHCRDRDIQIIGDMPIYINYDSADVWVNPGMFNLDGDDKPVFVAGVPPDYFSSTGQRWGHPVYNWDALKQTGYSWWLKRIGHNLGLFHMFRLDHFRGLVAYWRIRTGDSTAVNGEWTEAPAEDFFNTLTGHFKSLPIIAEDLGYITQDVRHIMERHGFPGMKVLLFAFGEDIATNPYAPHNHVKNCVVYTGTHDNNTVKGWFKKELGRQGKKRLSAYTGRELSEKNVHLELIRLAMMSVADTVIIPMQDILGLGEEARMNLPATVRGNWGWRLRQRQLTARLIRRLSEVTGIYGRSQKA